MSEFYHEAVRSSSEPNSVSPDESPEHFKELEEAKSFPQFEPIRTARSRDSTVGYHSSPNYEFSVEDQSHLAKLASSLSRSQTHRTPAIHDGGESDLARKDTVADMDLNNPRFNPNESVFDFFLWARKFFKLLEEDGIKRRRTGFTFKHLNVSGSGAALQLQDTVDSLYMAPFRPRETFGLGHKTEKRILKDFNGTVRSGEMLIVLGRPGSGCSTFLKSICGELYGFDLSKESIIHYDGIPQGTFKKELKGDAVYNQENEKHFPHLTVGETLQFAAAARTPSLRVKDIPRKEFSDHMAAVTMNISDLPIPKIPKSATTLSAESVGVRGRGVYGLSCLDQWLTWLKGVDC